MTFAKLQKELNLPQRKLIRASYCERKKVERKDAQEKESSSTIYSRRIGEVLVQRERYSACIS